MKDSAKKRVGVLRGGGREHYTSSLKIGGDIISHILENLSDKYKPVDILIDKDGIWHANGISIKPTDLMHRIDIAWNVSDPRFSNILDSLSIQNVSTGFFYSALENSKEILREHLKGVGVAIPRSIVLPAYQKDFDGPRASPVDGLRPRERYSIKKAKEVHEKFAPPWVVKSFTSDSNMGVHLAHTFNELVAGIEDGVKRGESVLVEEFIVGKVLSMHSVSGFRGEDIYIFPVVNVFGSLSSIEKEKLMILTKNLHKHLDAKHYLKSNFVLNKRGKIYLLDFESVPNLKSHSHFSQACESVGAKMHHVIENILG